MPTDDLKTHALSTEDFYALLDVTPGSSEAEIRRAYRRTALKYHPDKHGGSTEAVDKFHLLQIAYDVLSDATAKGVYDAGRRAREEREQRERAFGDRRRRMKEDLERRESGVKRYREEDEQEERLQAEIRRLAADGARRRREKTDQLRREQEEEDERLRQGPGEHVGATEVNGVSEMDRAVKIKWRRQGGGEAIDKASLEAMFKRYGEVDTIVVLKDKKKKLDHEKKSKTMIGTAMVVYKSLASALIAVEEASKLASDTFDSLESVFWATNEEPSVITQLRTPGTTPAGSLSREEITRIRMRIIAKRQQEARDAQKADEDRPAVRKVPSFASFKNVSTPQKAPKASFSASNTPLGYSSPGLEELQRRRQREEEKRRLEEQIRAQEAAEE